MQPLDGNQEDRAVCQTRESSSQTERVSGIHLSQSESGHFRFPCQTVIQQKAFSGGMRVEELLTRPCPHNTELHSQALMPNKPGVYWHLRKTTGHQVGTCSSINMNIKYIGLSIVLVIIIIRTMSYRVVYYSTKSDSVSS